MKRAGTLREIQKAEEQSCQLSNFWDYTSEGSEQDSKADLLAMTVIVTAWDPHFYWVTFRGSQIGTNWVC